MYLAEELLENILSYSLSSHPSTALPLLSASKRTNRIAIPLLLAHLRLRTHEHASQLAAVFERLPSYASKVRTVRIDSIDFADAFSTIATHLARSGVKLERLDIPVDKERFYEHLPVLGPCAVMMERERIAHDNWQKTVDTFCNALRRLPDTHELVVRDGGVKQNVLPGQWVRKAQLQEALANAIAHWPSLETVDLLFKPSPAPSLTIQSKDPLSSALADAPSLRIIRTQAPTILNAFFTQLSSSSSLQRIELLDDFRSASKPSESGIGAPPFPLVKQGDVTRRPNTLFRTQLQKHPKLQSLVLAGDEYLDNVPLMSSKREVERRAFIHLC